MLKLAPSVGLWGRIISRLVGAVEFDGTNDYMLRGAGLTGAADSKSGIFSAWIRLDGDSTNMEIIVSATFQFQVYYDATDDKFFVYGYDSTSATALELYTGNTYNAGATWLHLLFSWDVATAARHGYVNDVSDLDAGSGSTDLAIDYTETNWGIGADTDSSSGKLDGCLAELYFAPGQYLDLSVEFNRRKFIASDGKPAYLGPDGSAPTGTAPLVYLHLDPAETPANFAANHGSGGNFSVTGTLTAASTSPSD